MRWWPWRRPAPSPPPRPPALFIGGAEDLRIRRIPLHVSRVIGFDGETAYYRHRLVEPVTWVFIAADPATPNDRKVPS